LYPVKSAVRAAARWSGIFIITESLLGAMLVLFEWVALDDSIQRAISMPLHLINTLLLLASLTLTAWYANGYASTHLWEGMKQRKSILLATLGLMLIGASGAITALGDTLFPQATILDDFAAGAHFLIRLRLWHPVIALLVGYLIIQQVRNWPVAPSALKTLLIGLILLQWVLGAFNVALRAPVWLQLTHLLLADTIWICYTLFLNQTLQEELA
jgi:heme A synthase